MARNKRDQEVTRQSNEQQPAQQSAQRGSLGMQKGGDSGGPETQGSSAGTAASHRSENAESIASPTNKVVGFIDDLGDAQAALRDLRAAGFTVDEIEVLAGEEGAHRLDADGDEHGLLTRIVRSIQRVGDYEIAHVRRHEQELLAGHFGIGVTAEQREDREKVREILKSHNGHFINFYGTWAMEELEP